MADTGHGTRQLGSPARAERAPRTGGRARLVGIGHVALDHQFTVASLPTLPVKVPSQGYRAVVGGMTANACVVAARLGAEVAFASPVGSDDAADRFATYLGHEGVQADGLHRVSGAGSSVSAVLVDAQGERLIVIHRGDALDRAPAFHSTGLPAAITQADVLLTDPRCPVWADAALRHARACGVCTVFDADTSPRAELQGLVALADWAVFSTPGLAAYAGQSKAGTAEDEAGALARALASGAQVAVVTRGAAGMSWQRAGQPLQHLPGFVVGPVVDTTGAGDAFHGALAVALAEGLGDHEALRFAAATAALKCLRPGGVLGAPGRADVLALMAGAPRVAP